MGEIRMEKICQSCAMPLMKPEEVATNSDGSKNEDYCIHCYKDGEFTSDVTMEEMVETNLKYLDEWNKAEQTSFTEEEARNHLLKIFPELKRWKYTCTEECASGYNPNCTCENPQCHCTESCS